MRIEAADDGVRLPLLVVPGASRDGIAGEHGGALRIRVTAPPEKGRANAAVCALLARTLGVRKADVVIDAGHGSRRKTALIRGVDVTSVRSALGLPAGTPGRNAGDPGSTP